MCDSRLPHPQQLEHPDKVQMQCGTSEVVQEDQEMENMDRDEEMECEDSKPLNSGYRAGRDGSSL